MGRSITDVPITRVWHAFDVAIGIYAVQKNPTKFNWLRLGFALIGLGGNIVIAYSRKR